MANLTAENRQEHDYGPARLKEFYFRYDGVRYVMVEARGGAIVNYRDAINKQVKALGRQITSDGAAKFEPQLLAQCVFQLSDENENRLAMSADWCRGLGGEMFRDLFTRLEKMSGLSVETDSLVDRVAKLESELERLKGDLDTLPAAGANGKAEGNSSIPSMSGGS